MSPLLENSVRVPVAEMLLPEASVMVPLPPAFMVTDVPDVLALRAIEPLLPACNVKVLLAVMPLLTVMPPVPLAVMLTVVPEVLALSRIAPLVPACRVRAPLAVMPLEMVILPLLVAESTRLKIAPEEVPLTVTALESLTYTLPVVLAIRLGALVRI